MGDDSEWVKLPTDEKVQHKVYDSYSKTKLFGICDSLLSSIILHAYSTPFF